MKVGDLVRHQSIEALGTGIVTSTSLVGSAHCCVLWSKEHLGSGHFLGQPILEVVSKLEVISEGR